MGEAFPAMSEESIKTRLRRMQSIPVHPSAGDGIEKVRGSTPLISTIRNVCKHKGFRVFWPTRESARRGREGCFTTLYNTFAGLPERAESESA